VTDTTTLETASTQDEKPRRSGSLSTMKVAELQGLAASMGITGTAKMRKNDLVAAIKDRQSGGTGAAQSRVSAPEGAGSEAATATEDRREAAPAREQRGDRDAERPDRGRRTGEGFREERQQRRDQQERGGRDRATEGGDTEPRNRDDRDPRGNREGDRQARGDRDDRETRGERNREDRQGRNDRGDRGERDDRGDRDRGDRGDGRDRQQGRNQSQDQGGYDDDGEGRGGRRRNRNRNRNRDKRRRGDFGSDYDNEPQLSEDDVLVPVAGILDVLENYAFVRTSGYLPGPNDVYVPLGMVKKNGLRKGDAVTGAVKAQRDDQPQNQRQKFNALVRLDTVNGMSPEDAKKRVEFGKLTPLYPQERLRLETEPGQLTTRVIDLVAPIGKGQRGLIVSPPKAGKTIILQRIANAITQNNPEVHLMVVLVDERPEEVTDMQRSVKGEVIASTFDRPADDHTTVAELSIERAKRLVELGHDVVVLLDSMTRLGRAYNLAAPASGRILSGGVDSTALYPPKRFFGAARNIEDGGSLTILATALVETGSRMDEVIFEEFKGTGNMELKLDRKLADKRIFPAVDVDASGTRKEEILLAPEELQIVWKLRRVLHALDVQQALELLLDKLKQTKNNYDFLLQVQKTTHMDAGADD
jgi:transcription termination factor Rho